MMRASNSLAHVSYFPGIDEVPLRQLVKMSFSIKKNLFEPSCFSVPSLFDILTANAMPFHYIDHGLFDSDGSVYHRAVTFDHLRDVMVVRLIDLDTASHNYGLEGPGRIRTLQETDRFVERIISAWRHKNPNLAVLCFADHGMVPVKSSINVEASLSRTGLRAFRDFGMFLDSTMARFWGDEDALGKIRRTLEKLDCGRILEEKDLESYRLPRSSVWGDMIFLLKPGFVISPNFFDRNGHVKAMHGYDPSTPGLETTVIANWPEHVAPRPLTNAAMIDVLPTALDILRLEGPPHLPGTSLLGS
jgi:predicted AlkP superfamily pyrophosphatase or phosphodiesterase